MKPKNFPMRKLLRKFIAEGIDPNSEDAKRQLEAARAVRTKTDSVKPGGKRLDKYSMKGGNHNAKCNNEWN